MFQDESSRTDHVACLATNGLYPALVPPTFPFHATRSCKRVNWPQILPTANGGMMLNALDSRILDDLLDSWTRSNTILLNVLRALPDGGLDATAMEGSPAVARQFAHIQHTRRYFLSDMDPQRAEGVASLFHPVGEGWAPERDPTRIAPALEASAAAIAAVVRQRLESGGPLRGEHVTYDHPILFLQHMLWHEGYHVGQIKLALKAMGSVMGEDVEEQTIWSVWRQEVW